MSYDWTIFNEISVSALVFTGLFSRSGFVICIEYFSAIQAVNGVHISIITYPTNEFIPDTLIQTAKYHIIIPPLVMKYFERLLRLICCIDLLLLYKSTKTQLSIVAVP